MVRWGRDPEDADDAEIDKPAKRPGKGWKPEGREKQGKVSKEEKPAVKKHYEKQEKDQRKGK